jgi:hypothetical protein
MQVAGAFHDGGGVVPSQGWLGAPAWLARGQRSLRCAATSGCTSEGTQEASAWITICETRFEFDEESSRLIRLNGRGTDCSRRIPRMCMWPLVGMQPLTTPALPSVFVKLQAGTSRRISSLEFVARPPCV